MSKHFPMIATYFKSERIWDRKRRSEARNNGPLYFIVKFIGRLIAIMSKWQIEGLENIPKEGPYIIVLNHVSFIDAIVAFFMIPRRLFIMAKSEFFDPTEDNLPREQYYGARFFGWLLPLLGTFPIKRGKPDRKNLVHTGQILFKDKGNGVLIFPEDHISIQGNIENHRGGVAWLAMKLNTPIIIAYMVGTGATFPGYRKYNGRKKIIVRKGPVLNDIPETVIVKDELTGEETSQEVTGRMARNIFANMVEKCMVSIGEKFWSEYGEKTEVD